MLPEKLAHLAPDPQQGQAAIYAAMQTLPQGVTKREALTRLEAWPVPYGWDRSVPLGALLEGLPDDMVQNPRASAVELDARWGRIVGSLKAMPDDE